MNVLYKNIKSMRIRLGMSQEELAKKVGYGDRTSIAKIESGKVDLPQSKIETFATALNTTPGYLMGLELSGGHLSVKDQKDIAKAMNLLLEQMDNSQQEALMFDGEPLDEESRKLLKASLENSLKMAKLLAKQKYTPKKYRK